VRAPSPRSEPAVGHLGRWAREPLTLLEEGAALGSVFTLRLWRRATVGFSPEWNRFVLGDLARFPSKGSMSGFSPYLGAGVVQTDAPAHRDRRRLMNPPFARRSVDALGPRLREVARRRLPSGTFDAVAWSSALVRELLCEAFFAGRFPADLLHRFLRPLDRALPAPFVRRPVLFRQMNRALGDALRAAPDGTLAAALREVPNGLHETRVALAAGYDTTAHTLAWLLYHVADDPDRQDPAGRPNLINEVLRLYPAGWLGSRRCAVETQFEGIDLPRGSLVLYSPYLTHRDPARWKEPLQFRPERFEDPLPAWGFLPFSAGERTCLGGPLARLFLDSALSAFDGARLRLAGGDPRLRAGLTLTPAGPLYLSRTPR
jgi:cytochrome P450